MQKRREIRGSVALLIRGVVLGALLASPSCHSEKSARDEASDVLERIARLDPSAPADARRAAIDAVAAVPLANEELAGLRSVCIDAHRGLLEAELVQADVRKAIDGAPPTPDALAVLQAKMQQASETLAKAQTALNTCEKLSRDATVRYR